MLDLKKVPRSQETLLYQSKKPILDGHKDQILDFLPTFEDMEKGEVLYAIRSWRFPQSQRIKSSGGVQRKQMS